MTHIFESKNGSEQCSFIVNGYVGPCGCKRENEIHDTPFASKQMYDAYSALKDAGLSNEEIIKGIKEDTPSVEPKGWAELRAEVAGAVARGWCSKENEHKVMDADLAYAIVDQIMPLLASQRKELMEQIRGMVPEKNNDWLTHEEEVGWNACRTEMLRRLDEIK